MDETEATQVDVDLYREVHKGLRLALFDLVQQAGALDGGSGPSVESFVRLFGDIDMMLQTHHGHEDGEHLGSLIAQHASQFVMAVEAAHENSEKQLEELRSLVSSLGDGVDNADAIYDAVVSFTSDYLDHMQIEENDVMPALQAGASIEDLMAITMAIRTSVPPPDMCVFLRYMLPAMNPDERTATLGGMKAGAPPEIFDLFWGVASENLASSDLAVVAGRLAA